MAEPNRISKQADHKTTRHRVSRLQDVSGAGDNQQVHGGLSVAELQKRFDSFLQKNSKMCEEFSMQCQQDLDKMTHSGSKLTSEASVKDDKLKMWKRFDSDRGKRLCWSLVMTVAWLVPLLTASYYNANLDSIHCMAASIVILSDILFAVKLGSLTLYFMEFVDIYKLLKENHTPASYQIPYINLKKASLPDIKINSNIM